MPLNILDITAFFVFAFLCIRFFVVMLNLWQDPRLRKASKPFHGKISVLIPARNEIENLPVTLLAWKALSPQIYEVLVLDDHSDDGTGALVLKMQQDFPKLKLLQGTDLPKGWLGKNFACHQLAAQATGDFFLFADADVKPQKGLIEATTHQLAVKHLGLLSIFPDQELVTKGEKVAVPIMHYLLLTLLPLFLIHRFKFPSLAAANGQFMLFDAKIYRKYQWHKIVKNKVAEDIQTVREMKMRGERAATFLGGGLIWCRMYTSYPDAVGGFSKNFLAGFGNIFGVLFYLFILTFGWVIVGLFQPVLLAPAVFIILLTNFGLAQLSNQSFLMLLWTHPLRIFATLQIAVSSIIRKLKKENQWKGRNVDLSSQ